MSSDVLYEKNVIGLAFILAESVSLGLRLNAPLKMNAGFLSRAEVASTHSHRVAIQVMICLSAKKRCNILEL
jgi:hypothetical protein